MPPDSPSLAAGNRERSEVLANILCEEIIKGQLEPGEKLSELAIASRFDVSRGPVREALRRLSERNLVVFSPNAGARVVSTSVDDMIYLLEVRESLEVTAAQFAAAKMSKKEKLHLHDLYQNHTSMFSREKHRSFFHCPEDLDFHYAIAKGAKNPVLFKILCQDLYPRFMLCRSQHQHIQDRGVKALTEHYAILTAIENGDSELAGIYMKRHIRAARTGLMAWIKPAN